MTPQAFKKRLLLVDLENVHRVDMSLFDESYSAIVFVGASQQLPKGARKARTAHRFKRVDFQKVQGHGKDALDFHIAFQLGRVIETWPDTVCFVVSRDKGFDPLLAHLKEIGLSCRRVGSFDELLGLVCGQCNKDMTVDHNGGRWCANCGVFSVEPNIAVSTRAITGSLELSQVRRDSAETRCDWCYQTRSIEDGIFDDGEWMCGACIGGWASNSGGDTE